MSLPWQSLEGFAGATGVGVLAVLAVFLFVDARSRDFLSTFEHYAGTSSWGIVAAIPVLSVSYVLGLVLMGGAELLITLLPWGGSVPADLVIIGTSGNEIEIVSQKYIQLIQERDILGGSGLAFLMLSIGAASETRWLPELRRAIYFLSGSVVVLALICFALAIMKAEAAHELVEQLEQLKQLNG